MFDERKVAQMAAFFLGQTHEKRMPHLKLMKLLYLSDRKAMRDYGFPLTGDWLVAMPHGPVLSMTLDLINGGSKLQSGGWNEWISGKENYEVSTRKSFTMEDLDELSEACLNVLRSVWEKFGGMDKWEIRDWTNNNCKEWKDPRGSSRPISFQSMAVAVGFEKSSADKVALLVNEEKKIDTFFASL